MLKRYMVFLSFIAFIFCCIGFNTVRADEQTDLIKEAIQKGVIKDFDKINYQIKFCDSEVINYLIRHHMFLNPDIMHCQQGVSPSLTGWEEIDFYSVKSEWLMVKISGSPFYQYLILKSGEVCGNSTYPSNFKDSPSVAEKAMKLKIVIGDERTRRFTLSFEDDFCLEWMQKYGLSIQGENLYLARENNIILLNPEGDTTSVKLCANYESVFVEINYPTLTIVYFVCYGQVVDKVTIIR